MYRGNLATVGFMQKSCQKTQKTFYETACLAPPSVGSIPRQFSITQFDEAGAVTRVLAVLCEAETDNLTLPVPEFYMNVSSFVE